MTHPDRTHDEPADAALATALSMAEVAVADMAEAGIDPMMIAIALASQLNLQARRAMSSDAAALAFKLGLIDAPTPMVESGIAAIFGDRAA